jgi:hypothetical protein
MKTTHLALALALAATPQLGACSFCEGFSEVLQGEVAADVDIPTTFTSLPVTLQYPGNWSMDTDDPDHHPDTQFIIETTGECQFMVFFVPSAVDERDILQEYVEQFSKLMPNPKRAAFDTWGRYKGAGTTLTGALLVIPGQIRIFVHSDDDKGASFSIVEQCYDEDMAEVRPGFQLIEGTFDWHPAGTE